jgi:Ala-tRNA(Pro) deacylase
MFSMWIGRRIRDYLYQYHVAYARYAHATAYTAQDIAHAEFPAEADFAKTVVLRADDRLILAVLPADDVINFEILKRQIGCAKLSLALEKEFIQKFRDCQPGAVPPFGNLFKVPLYCDTVLAKHAGIEFNAGTYDETIRMKYAAFVTLENPIVLSFSEKRYNPPAVRAA